MRSQYLRSVTSDAVAAPMPFPRDSKLIFSKIANIGVLVSNLNAAVEDLESLDLPQLDDQFDFYREVERFEVNLIKSALRITGGSQVKAARLLKLKATTLNAKMKMFNLVSK